MKLFVYFVRHVPIYCLNTMFMPTKTIKSKLAGKASRQETSSTDAALPSPDRLLEMAMGEADRRILDDYADAIRVLRDDKRFTFREIAQWLKQNGVQTDHNSVYRAYRKHLPPEAAEKLDQEMALNDNERKG
jgi:hypothetical protein